MNLLLELFDRATAARIVSVLAHSLWQAPLLAMLVWLAIRRLPARRSNVRYVSSLVALVAVLMAAAGTWCMTRERPVTSHSWRPSPDPSQMHAGDSGGLTNIVGVVATAATETPGNAQRSGRASWGEGQTGATPLLDHWQAGIVIAWLVGVCLMLVRTARTAHGALGLGAEGCPLPEGIMSVVRELCARMGISRRVTVLASKRVRFPGVIGVVWPVLVLPISMLTKLPPDDLRAIIAHELAHIRRYDYALNLVQMVIESLFFFNPAVWWISRRVRVEREACADADAVALTGQSIQYASLLADVAERLAHDASSVPVLVGLAEQRDDGTLLERVKRIVEPGELPNVYLPWGKLLLVMLISAAAVATIWQGTSTVVGLARDLMTDRQRVETVTAEQNRFAPATRTIGKGEGKVHGTVRTEDGQPLPEAVWLYYNCHRERGSTLGTLANVGQKFTASVPSGTVWLLASADGYAPVYVGPFQVLPNEDIHDVEIVLPVGFQAAIRVTDEEGRPIEGAKVSAALLKQGGSVGPHKSWATDTDGIAQVAHASPERYRIAAKRSGYQPLQREASFSSDRPLEIQLEAARPFLGHVVSAGGKAVGGAKVRLLCEVRRDGSGNDHGNWGPTVATTDGQGQFTLDQLNDGWQYVLLIESEDWGRAVMPGVVAGTERTVTMGLKLEVRGMIVGPVDELDRNRRGPYVTIFQTPEFRLDRRHSSSLYEKVPVHIENGVASFKYSNLMPGEVLVQAARHRAKTSVGPETPIAKLRIDLSEPMPVERTYRRRVVLRFVRDRQTVLLEGTVRVLGHAAGNGRELIATTIPVSDGQLAIDVPVPGRVQCDPANIAGWYFERVSEEVARGEEPLQIDVPVIPAGAVKGRVTFPPGQASDKQPLVSVLARWEDKTRKFSTRQDSIWARIDGQGRFFITPVPLGAKCSVKLSVGHNIQVSELFTLDAVRPVRAVDLRLPKPMSAEVRLTDPEGHPVPELPIKLHWEQSGASGNVWELGRTDGEGRVIADAVNAEVPRYHVEIKSRRTWQPLLTPLHVDGSVTAIQLKRGEQLVGTVIDAASGFPVPGVEVYALRSPVSTAPWSVNVFEAQAPTTKDGRYQFSNLPDATVKLGLRGMQFTSQDHNVHPGRQDRLDLRGKIPSWSSLRPEPPEK